jgi:hypothetical protein
VLDEKDAVALEPALAPNLGPALHVPGMAQLRKLPSHIQKIYYPIDRRDYVSRAILTIHPEAILLVEAEIWPNFLWRARDLRVPTFLVNARLSQSSYRGSRRFGFLFRPLFAAFGKSFSAPSASWRSFSASCWAREAIKRLDFSFK